MTHDPAQALRIENAMLYIRLVNLQRVARHMQLHLLRFGVAYEFQDDGRERDDDCPDD